MQYTLLTTVYAIDISGAFSYILCTTPRPGGGGGGVLLGNLGGGVLPGTPNPDPVSDPKMSFSTLVFRPRLKHYRLAFRPEIT